MMVTEALCFLSISILPYVFRDCVTRIFYSFNDSKTPFIIATCAILLKYLLNVILITKLGLGIAGITLSTSFITLFNAILLGVFVLKKIKLNYTPLFKNLCKMLIAGGLTFVTCIEISNFINSLELARYFHESLKIITITISCFGFYTILNIILRVSYANELYIRIRDKIKP